MLHLSHVLHPRRVVLESLIQLPDTIAMVRNLILQGHRKTPLSSAGDSKEVTSVKMQKNDVMEFELETKSESLLLERAIVSYGFVFMAPNKWDMAHKSFCRPLTLFNSTIADVCLTQPGGKGCAVQCRAVPRECMRLEEEQQEEVKMQVRRMLRLGEVHEQAALEAFAHKCPYLAYKHLLGRVFRSPTTFEDMIKQICLTNVTFNRSIEMNRRLCQHVGSFGDSFPSPAQLSQCSEEYLKKTCKVGYRASRIISIAQLVHSGELDLHSLQQDAASVSCMADAVALKRKLCSRLPGFGDYSSKNLLQMLGVYYFVPGTSGFPSPSQHALIKFIHTLL